MRESPAPAASRQPRITTDGPTARWIKRASSPREKAGDKSSRTPTVIPTGTPAPRSAVKPDLDSLREALRTDAAFLREFASASSHEAAGEVAARRGWALDTGEIRTLRESLAPATDELSETELETISGGISNVMKTRHDTAKNSIGNIR
jgi:hypothetical protein